MSIDRSIDERSARNFLSSTKIGARHLGQEMDLSCCHFDEKRWLDFTTILGESKNVCLLHFES